jgi:hypothetical protein
MTWYEEAHVYIFVCIENRIKWLLMSHSYISIVDLYVLYNLEINIFKICLALKQIFNISDILIETTQYQITVKMLT